MTTLTESDVEQVALDWLASVGWKVAHGPEIAPDSLDAERTDYGEVVLAKRLRDALAELNRHLPADALDDAFRKLIRPEGATLEARNRAFHRMLVEGVNRGVPGGRWRHSRGAGAGHRLRRTRQQRLAGGQPVHRHRESTHPPTRRGAVRQRPAAGHH